MAKPSQPTTAPVIANREQPRLASPRKLTKLQSQWTTSRIPAEKIEQNQELDISLAGLIRHGQ
jgi:hypothetical protein